MISYLSTLLSREAMENRIFYTQFSIITIISALLIGGSLFVPMMAGHIAIGWIYLVFFCIFVWVSFFMGKKAASSENKNDFTRLVITLIFLKLLFCIMIVLCYDKFMQPSDSNHVIYFLVLYIVYSFFEFSILTKLGQSK